MYLIDYHDDDRDCEGTIGPFVEMPTAAQAIAAVRAETADSRFNGFSWCVYSIGDVIPLPTPSEDDVRLAKGDTTSGYVNFRRGSK